jgi:hypothetical protein
MLPLQILVLWGFFVDVGDCGFRTAGVEGIGSRRLIVVVVVILQVMLLGLDLIQFVLHLLNFIIDLQVTTTVRP